MFIDLNVEDAPGSAFDICILGAGPAGITLARAFAETDVKVLLVEGGGLERSEDSQSILECDSTAMDAWPQFTRLRYFGGTSNHWAGRCRPFDASDFSRKSFADLPGWPIPYSEIEPYLEQAMNILDLPNEGFIQRKPIKLDSRFISDAFAKSPPTRFGQKYHSLIESSSNIVCLLNANGMEIEMDSEQSAVLSLGISGYAGKTSAVSAEYFILAMGAIENARFLLNQKVPVGNRNGMVGKCFMEHMNVRLGEYISENTDDPFTNQFFTSESFKAGFETGASNATFGLVDEVRSFGRTAQIKNFFKSLACDWNIEDKLEFIANIECPGMGRISTLMEQSPGRQSYVGLADDLDSLGMRKAVLNWELNRYDLKTIRTVAKELARAFGDSGLGIVRLPDYILDESLEVPVAHHAHHMGTTRMSDSYETGVVDRDCKVFDTDNLYIAGSSIFATGGACNPTMPLIQFALRLADHLKRKIAA